jgi:L-ascorbate metabolism protein UlaG (beta-lactamase superfamily)
MNTGGARTFPFGNLKLTIAHHTSMLPDGANGGSPCGFGLTLGDGKIYFACDTALFSDMKLIGSGGLDLAVVPIGDLFTMGPDDALEAVKLLKPRRVVPSHYNTWPPISQDAAAWAARVKSETSSEPIVIEPGGTVTL